MSEAQALLVVEDEPLVRMMIEQLLVDAGFKVHVAETGIEAIHVMNLPRQLIHGLVTDVRLGTGPDGWAVAHRARELHPEMPVVYVTGDSAHEWAARGVPKSILIQKPFRATQLTQALGNLLH